MKWFVSCSGDKAGPFSTAEILDKLLSNEVDDSALVWRSGLPDWQPISAHFRKPIEEKIAEGSTASLPVTGQNAKANVVIRFWRGAIALPTAYWLVAFLGNILLLVAYAIVLLSVKDAAFDPHRVFAFYSAIWTFACLWAAFQSVGVWRSANQYIRAAAGRDRPVNWGRAAQAVIIAQLVLLGAQLAITGVPQLRESWRIAFQDDPGTPNYHLRVMRHGTEMELHGGFKYGLTKDIETLLKANPRVTVLHLNSMGGRVGEAQELAALIKKRGLITYTSDICASACALSFAAGRERWLAEKGRLGYHSGNFAGKDSPAAMKAALEKGGLPTAFVARAITYASNDMWYPSQSELLSQRVITGIADNYRFASSGYGAAPSAAEFRERLLGLPFYRTLAQFAPAQFDTVLRKFQDEYLAGTPEGTLIDELRSSIIAPLLKARMVRSSDELAVQYAQLIADQYAALGKRDPKLCYEFATKGASTKALNSLPPTLITRELELGERALKEQGNATRGTKKQLDSAYALIGSNMAKRFSNADLDLLDAPGRVSAYQYKLYCDMAIMMFQEIAKLKASDSGYLMRDIFSQ